MSNLVLNRESFLSDGVYHMVCGLNEDFKKIRQPDETDNANKEAFKLNINALSLSKHEDGSIDFVKTVQKLLPSCYSVDKQLMLLTAEQFDAKFGMDLEWTGNRETLVECFMMMKDGHPVDVLLSLLLLSSIMEHSLGDIYLSKSNSKPCPTNIKELVLSEEIQELIGYNVSMVIYVLAGPPQGVNLRNIVWHGFSLPMEVPPQYCTFLLFMLSSMNCKLSDVCIKKRKMVTFTKYDALLNFFPTINPSESDVICHAFHNSKLISPRMLPIWERALKYYQERRYGFVLVLLMPQLEHLLRRMFAWVNQCPERVLTAESCTLYTTFDEILAPSLPDGSENQLKIHMGDHYLEMLLDVLVHCGGPRIRDHISHGEVDLESVPKKLCSHVICICVVFAVHFSVSSSLWNRKNSNYRETNDGQISIASHDLGECSIEDHDEISNNLIQKILQAADSYCSVYHPIEILKRDVCSASKCVEDLNTFSIPNDLGIEEASSLNNEEIILKAINKMCSRSDISLTPELVVLNKVGEFAEQLQLLSEMIKLPTMFRPKKELEIVSLLCSIVQHSCITAVQVRDTASQRYQQWLQKQLRSRQRANYKKLLTFLPFYRVILKLMLVLVLVELASLHENTSKSNYIKFLKRLLQCSENLESLSSPSKNRWDEFKAIGDQILQLIDKHVPNNTK